MDTKEEFEMRLKPKCVRQRFYSSMTHEEYCDLFGPPTPIVKYLIPLCRPLEDPTEDIPIFELEPGCVLDPLEEREQSPTGLQCIIEIDGSDTFTQKKSLSPMIDLFSSQRSFSKVVGPKQKLSLELQLPTRTRVRCRSQSDNSEYLIFNFLERSTQRYTSYNIVVVRNKKVYEANKYQFSNITAGQQQPSSQKNKVISKVYHK